jgi:hypothetical protein
MGWFRLLMLGTSLAAFCESTPATSIVILANQTQIAVAADSKMLARRGREHKELNVCKIWSHRNFFFAFAGMFANDSSDAAAGYSAVNLLLKASTGLKDFEKIDSRFDNLIRAPLQRQIDADFAADPASFREKHKGPEPIVLELAIFGITSNGTEMLQSNVTLSFVGGRPKIGKINHYSCKNGTGDCFMPLGARNAIDNEVAIRPLTGDLAADAERLVNVEVQALPQSVGGPIRVILIDRSGVDKRNPQDSCPEPR